jgi:hypothetical protein
MRNSQGCLSWQRTGLRLPPWKGNCANVSSFARTATRRNTSKGPAIQGNGRGRSRSLVRSRIEGLRGAPWGVEETLQRGFESRREHLFPNVQPYGLYAAVKVAGFTNQWRVGSESVASGPVRSGRRSPDSSQRVTYRRGDKDRGAAGSVRRHRVDRPEGERVGVRNERPAAVGPDLVYRSESPRGDLVPNSPARGSPLNVNGGPQREGVLDRGQCLAGVRARRNLERPAGWAGGVEGGRHDAGPHEQDHRGDDRATEKQGNVGLSSARPAPSFAGPLKARSAQGGRDGSVHRVSAEVSADSSRTFESS